VAGEGNEVGAQNVVVEDHNLHVVEVVDSEVEEDRNEVVEDNADHNHKVDNQVVIKFFLFHI